MEHLLLALVSFVRSHFRLYHSPCIILIKRYFARGNHFCRGSKIYPVTVNTERHSILSILVSRTSNSTKTWSVSRPGIHFSGIETSASGIFRSEICAPGICMIRNVFEGFHSFAPLLSIFPPYRRGSLKTLKRIVEKCSVSGWKRIFLRGLIEWNLESNMIIGNVDTGKASLELDEIVLKIGGGVLFKFLSLDFIRSLFIFKSRRTGIKCSSFIWNKNLFEVSR